MESEKSIGLGAKLSIAIALLNASLISTYVNWIDGSATILEINDVLFAVVPKCLTSWSNASIEYRDFLVLVSFQSIVISLTISVVSFVFAQDSRRMSASAFDRRARNRLIFGILALYIWYCWIGAQSPIEDVRELGKYSYRLFNHQAGVLVAALLPHSIGFALGKDLRRLSKALVNKYKVENK